MSEEYQGIWIFAEQEAGCLNPCVFELLTKAKELQTCNHQLISAVLLGSGIRTLTGTLFACGADQVILCDDPALEVYSARPYEKAMSALSCKHRPSILLFGTTPLGRDLAPRVMVSLNTGLTADAIDLGYDQDGAFYQTTPGYGGKLLAHIVIPRTRPQMATVHPGICEPAKASMPTEGILIEEKLDLQKDPDYEVMETVPVVRDRPPLNKASTVVAGGRGLKKEEDLNMLEDLAALLEGQVASSRPLVDCGWLPHDRQIGQSGTTVKPQLMFNIAVSGSVQYMLGMEKAGCIVAVNQDRSAPIFDPAHFGIVEDYRKFIPTLIEEIKKRRGEN